MAKVFDDPLTQKRCGDIVDYSFPTDRPRDLASAILDISPALAVPKLTAWALPHTPAFGVLKSMNFNESTQVRFFCVKALTVEAAVMYDFKRWHLVEADSEIY